MTIHPFIILLAAICAAFVFLWQYTEIKVLKCEIRELKNDLKIANNSYLHEKDLRTALKGDFRRFAHETYSDLAERANELDKKYRELKDGTE